MTNQQVTQWTPELIVHGVSGDFKTLAKTHNAVNWEAEYNYAVQQLYKNDFARKIATNNPVSAQNAVRNVAAIGLTLNPALRYAYLVPRDGAICLDVSYMGLMHLAQDTGSIMWAQCKIVHLDDNYQNNGASAEPSHKYSPFGDRGPIVGAYCVAKTHEGDFLTHEMAIADIYAIRDRSSAWKAYQSGKAKSAGPWGSDEGEMIKKTVVKQASKYWPKVERLHEAIEMVNNESGEGIDFDQERAEQEYDPSEDSAKLHQALEAEDLALAQLVVRPLEDWQMGKLFKAPFVNTKIRNLCSQANTWMVQQKAYLTGLIETGDEEGLVTAWNEQTDNERALMRKELPDDLVNQAREWVLAATQEDQQ